MFTKIDSTLKIAPLGKQVGVGGVIEQPNTEINKQ